LRPTVPPLGSQRYLEARIKEGPGARRGLFFREWRPLPVQLDGELELAGVGGVGGRLTRGARGARGGIADPLHGDDVGVVEKVEDVSNESPIAEIAE
jgi:hypothetical protein